MANAVSVKISGLDQVEQKLRELPSKFVRKALRNALRAGGRVLADEIRRGAERYRRTGWLASHIVVRLKLKSAEREGVALVGATRAQNPDHLGSNAAAELLWHEFGTKVHGKPHEPARPIVRPAFEAKKEAALGAFVEKLRAPFREVLGG